jgi:hypothetical protein
MNESNKILPLTLAIRRPRFTITPITDAEHKRTLSKMALRFRVRSGGCSAGSAVYSTLTGFSIRKIAFGHAVLSRLGIDATVTEVQLGSPCGFNGPARGHLEQVGIGDAGECLLDGFQQDQRIGQACIGPVINFRFEANASIGAAVFRPTLLDGNIEGASIVPSEANQKRP